MAKSHTRVAFPVPIKAKYRFVDSQRPSHTRTFYGVVTHEYRGTGLYRFLFDTPQGETVKVVSKKHVDLLEEEKC